MKIKNLILGASSIGLTAVAPIASATTTNSISNVVLNTQTGGNIEMDQLEVVKQVNKSINKGFSYKQYNHYHNVSFRSYEGRPGKVEPDILWRDLKTKKEKYNVYIDSSEPTYKTSDETAYGLLRLYKLPITVPANTEKYKVEVSISGRIKLYLNGHFLLHGETFAQTNIGNIATDPAKADIKCGFYNHEVQELKYVTQNYAFDCFHNKSYFKEWKSLDYCVKESIVLNNTTSEPKIIPIYFWHAFAGGGFKGSNGNSIISSNRYNICANHIE